MNHVVSGNEMHAIDAYAIHTTGIPSEVLMERAALSVFTEIRGRLSGKPSILCVCGSGNNGADGLALARMLKLADYPVRIVYAGDPAHATREWKLQNTICRNLNIPGSDPDEVFAGTSDAVQTDVIVDCIFGTGLCRTVSGKYAALINSINTADAYRIAVDIPSGIHADTGAVLGCAVRADLTVTFQYAKLGMLVYPGKEYTGITVVTDIGIPDAGREAVGACAYTLDRSDLHAMPSRPAHSNKGTFGRVLVIAGSPNMCGAAYLSGLAAYRSGAGLVEIFTCEENRTILQSLLPEAVLTTDQGFMPELLEQAAARADVIVFGPGMGIQDRTRNYLNLVLAITDKPVIIDADGLNVLSEISDRVQLRENMILTPHLKEFSRISGVTMDRLKEELITPARNFAETHSCVLVLKDAATTVIRKDRMYVNSCGNSGMATGGSGDVLTGIIAGTIASRKLKPYEGACCGVLIHGLSGDQAAKALGPDAVLARDLAAYAENVLCHTEESEPR